MSEAYTLDQFNTEFSEEDYAPTERKSGNRNPLKQEVCYQIEFTDTVVKTNDRGFTQVELALGRVKSNGDTVKAGRVWQTLPVFTKEKEEELGPEQTISFRKMYRDQLGNILRALYPTEYSLYASKKKNRAGKTEYFSADGEKISENELNIRKVAINKAVMDAAKDLITGNTKFTGKQVYFVETPNKKNPKFPYKNFFSEPSEKYPLASDEE